MGGPKGNKHAVGHGRPPTHTDPKEVERLIDDYFEWIKGEYKEEPIIETVVMDNYGRTEERDTGKTEIICIRPPEPPTVTGLSLHLDFCSKTSLYQYAEKEGFMHPIKKAISRIEKHHEIAIAHGDKCTGNIFALKNFGWKDKVETEVTGTQTIVWQEEKTYEANDKAD